MAPIEPVSPTEQFDASALEKDLHTNYNLEGIPPATALPGVSPKPSRIAF